MTALALRGVGVWGPGFEDWPALRARLVSGPIATAAARPLPPSELIPARERRRAPLMVRLALEAARQAVAASSIAPGSLHSVFASGMGDTGITDYVCRTLAGAPATLSPTQFHNSVHNAPAAYWSIATANHAPSNSISAFHDSFALAFIESATIVATEGTDVLLVLADVATRPPLDAVSPVTSDLGVALLLSPPGGSERRIDWQVITAREPATEPHDNPVCLALPLLERLARDSAEPLHLRLGRCSALSLLLHPHREESDRHAM